jgi:hypothetical protein
MAYHRRIRCGRSLRCRRRRVRPDRVDPRPRVRRRCLRRVARGGIVAVGYLRRRACLYRSVPRYACIRRVVVREAEVRDAEPWAERGRAVCARCPVRPRGRPERAAELVSGARSELAATMAAIELGKPCATGRRCTARRKRSPSPQPTETARGELLPARRQRAGTTAMCFRAPVGTVLAVTPFNAPVNPSRTRSRRASPRARTIVNRPRRHRQ